MYGMGKHIQQVAPITYIAYRCRCDSIVTLNLTINPVQGSPTTLTSCGSYIWNGQTFTISGTYKDTLLTSRGCDSIATLQLTILPVSNETITRSICQGQQYEGYTSTGILLIHLLHLMDATVPVHLI